MFWPESNFPSSIFFKCLTIVRVCNDRYKCTHCSLIWSPGYDWYQCVIDVAKITEIIETLRINIIWNGPSIRAERRSNPKKSFCEHDGRPQSVMKSSLTSCFRLKITSKDLEIRRKKYVQVSNNALFLRSYLANWLASVSLNNILKCQNDLYIFCRSVFKKFKFASPLSSVGSLTS